MGVGMCSWARGGGVTLVIDLLWLQEGDPTSDRIFLGALSEATLLRRTALVKLITQLTGAPPPPPPQIFSPHSLALLTDKVMSIPDGGECDVSSIFTMPDSLSRWPLCVYSNFNPFGICRPNLITVESLWQRDFGLSGTVRFAFSPYFHISHDGQEGFCSRRNC
jgi:hypothetical protein